jgi:hypothetical protein
MPVVSALLAKRVIRDELAVHIPPVACGDWSVGHKADAPPLSSAMRFQFRAAVAGVVVA